MASRAPVGAARPVCGDGSEARAGGRSPRRRRCPPGGLAASAGSSGARRVAGAQSGERAVSWSRTPVGRPGGRGSGGGRARGAGRPGFRGLARRARGGGAWRGVGARGGGLDRSASGPRADEVWRRARAGAGGHPQPVPPSPALPRPPPFLPAARRGAQWWPGFAGRGRRPRKEKRLEGCQWAGPEPTGLSAGEAGSCCHRVLTGAGRSRGRGRPGRPTCGQHPLARLRTCVFSCQVGRCPTVRTRLTSKCVTLGKGRAPGASVFTSVQQG